MLLVVIDAVEGLYDDRKPKCWHQGLILNAAQNRHLQWLPPSMPPNVHVVISCRGEPTLGLLKHCLPAEAKAEL